MVMNWHITFGRKAILSNSKQVKTALIPGINRQYDSKRYRAQHVRHMACHVMNHSIITMSGDF